MSTSKHLTRGRVEFGGIALAIVVGGGLAFGQVTGARSGADAAAAPIAGAPYFDHGWEVDNAPAKAPAAVAPVTGTPSWDRGWEVDNAPAKAPAAVAPVTGTPSWDHGWEVDNATKADGGGSR